MIQYDPSYEQNWKKVALAQTARVLRYFGYTPTVPPVAKPAPLIAKRDDASVALLSPRKSTLRPRPKKAKLSKR